MLVSQVWDFIVCFFILQYPSLSTAHELIAYNQNKPSIIFFPKREKHVADGLMSRSDPAQGGQKNKEHSLVPLLLDGPHSHRIRPDREQGPG